ncbi:hypothetical protein EH240_13140 [Mesorhizobium tamadayense]|uniref:Uncharacterized protein n=1 Tax=Mesorhizobium tamadayense TaxID=425306 RepID=A0A3P3FTM1_9HYPH|nr:hypothetical protein EH240_13140 [Mesorhizobium tamadayense]
MRAVAGIASILGIAVLVHWTSELGLPAATTLRLATVLPCKRDDRCDRLTGCVAPQAPPGPVLEVLPAGRDHERYVRDLAAFQACRELALAEPASAQRDIRLAAFSASDLERRAFADTVMRWNGDIFWRPASESTNIVTRSGDEARAVFGPIPEGDCEGPESKTIPREVDGNIVDLRPNPAKQGHPLEFEHRDQNGNEVKWTATLPKCDKPSLAGSATFCGLNSRLARVVRGNVEWLFLCRKSHYSQEVSTDPYWLGSDPRFSLFGTIGFNRQSGEIVFFDGRKDRGVFDWSKTFVPPGGHSYSDSVGRAEAEAFYDPTFQVPCHACHDNKSPYVIDPHIAQSRVGYRAAEKDSRATAFSLADYLPLRPRLLDSPFRVIGSGYTSTYSVDLMRAKTVQDPSGNCTGCHTLTTQITGQRLAPDAVSREPRITLPSWVQLLQLREEKIIYAAAAAHRTDWALERVGGIHPWMVPGSGNDLSLNSPGLSAEDWQRLSDCLWDAGGAECGYHPLYTPCPAPELEAGGSLLTNATIEVLPAPVGEATTVRVLRFGWKYLNGYGGVPERDDVRVNVAIKTGAMPWDRAPPKIDAYPTVEEAKGIDLEPHEAIGSAGSSLVIQNASYAGHTRWTDPVASTLPRSFRLDVPGKCNQRILIRLLPKRFCFDESNATYSAMDHLIYADIVCD